MHGASVNLELPSSLDKAVILIVSPLLSGSATGDLITQRPFTPISTVHSGCRYHCVTSTRWFAIHGWRASSTHTIDCVVYTRQVVCHDSRAPSTQVLGSEIFLLLGWLLAMLSSSSYPEHWFEGASISPFAHSPVCSKQFCHVKAKSWTWLSEVTFCAYLMGNFVGIRCSISSTIPAMKAHLLLLSLLLLSLLFKLARCSDVHCRAPC